MTNAFSMQFVATALILASALLHAAVNTLVKISGDGLITRGCMNGVACAVAVPLLFGLPLPGPDLWTLLAASVLVHALYPFFLVETYRTGDLSATYPLMRGAVPLLVTAFAALALEQFPGALGLLGIALVSLAVASFAVTVPLAGRAPARGLAFAGVTGVIIAMYTVIDAAGLRLAPTPFTYIAWLFALDGAVVAGLVALARRGAVLPFVATYWRSTLAAGVLGVLTYGLALLALALGPVAEIAALREMSIVFAALIGTLLLGEPFGKTRVIAASVAAAGIVIMHLGR